MRRLAAPLLVAQYVPVSVAEPQPYVTVLLKSPSRAIDVTRNNFVVSMKPLVLGVRLDESSRHVERGARLEFWCRPAGSMIGAIDLAVDRDYECGGFTFRTFRPAASQDRCLPLGWRMMHRVDQRFKAWRHQRRDPHNVQMTPRDLGALFVFYSCPRPVVLVSLEHDGRAVIFPMDLIGPTDSPLFSLALRTTNPAVEQMKLCGRFAIANVPLAYKDVAYALGSYDGRLRGGAAVPFAHVPSTSLALPVPVDAIRVREVRVEHSVTVGSHCWFLTSILSDSAPLGGALSTPVFSHIHGTCHRYLQRRGVLTGQLS